MNFSHSCFSLSCCGQDISKQNWFRWKWRNMFLGMENAKEGGFCTYPKCHLLSDAFLAINSLFQNNFSGKILKNHKCMYYWFWYFTKSWCQLWYWYFWNHQFWYLLKKPLNIFHWYHSLTLSAVSHALACERSDQCSVLRQWGERFGSICSNSSNRFCPAEPRCDKNWGEYKKVERN